MITLITGAPGSGKSAALVSLLADLSKTRAVYVSGIPDLKIDHIDLENPTDWINCVPDGSIIVIDEVQRIWRPRGPGVKVPPDIAALETHRHRGIDFYVVTQSPRLMDSNIRGLVGRHIHLRDLGLLGRWWYEWPECADSCSSSWKQAPLKKHFRLDKAALALYKSASIHIKPVRSIPWMLPLLLVSVVIAGYLAWRSYVMIQSKMAPAKTPVVASGVVGGGLIGDARAAVTGALSGGYDTTQFIPRVASLPESAPAFDAVRVVSAMPMVIGGMCVAEKCRCYTQQNTLVAMSDNECRQLITNPLFNPYQVARNETSTKGEKAIGHQSPVAAAALPLAPPSMTTKAL